MELTLDLLKGILFANNNFSLTDEQMKRVDDSFAFLSDFAANKVIYGINTGFGPMAQWRVPDRNLTDLQYNIIRSHSTGAGNPLPDVYVRAAMVARVGSFIQGKSGIHREVVELLVQMINKNIIPLIPEHGSVGASGDLVQLAHIALCLIGEGVVHYNSQWIPTKEAFRIEKLKPISIHIREGLSVTNGTSVMTGIASVNQLYAENLLYLSILAGVWINEIAESYDDMLSIPLNECRRHSGQMYIAAEMRRIASGNQCLRNREHALYDNGHPEVEYFSNAHKVQAYYSLRCLPQILGPVYETLQNAKRIIEEELNCASDNPIVDPITQNVYHGGNFHGDYISLEEDKVKIVVTRMAMLAERQLNYLFHDRINNILPPFLNKGTLGLNYGMQACQFTATSTTAECQTLSMPNYVHSIPNNNDNQDIVSMGTNSAELCKKVIDNAYQVMSILFIALAQASDCLNNVQRLSPATRKTYEEIRLLTPTIVDDTPFYEDIARVGNRLRQLA